MGEAWSRPAGAASTQPHLRARTATLAESLASMAYWFLVCPLSAQRGSARVAESVVKHSWSNLGLRRAVKELQALTRAEAASQEALRCEDLMVTAKTSKDQNI